MSKVIVIMGESGTGKSTSIESLPPENTFLFSATAKDLPFRGWQKKYTALTKENTNGNYYHTDDYALINKIITHVEARESLKYIVIDDAQYLMGNEFMRRSTERGYDKFTEIGRKFWDLIIQLSMLRKDIIVFVLTHSEVSQDGRAKIKTIGKMLDEKITIDGMFTILLTTVVDKDQYFFETQGQGLTTAKSPRGMFETLRIPNDLLFVANKIKNYYEEN